MGSDVLACIFPVLKGRISRYPLDHLLELGRPEVTERYIGQILRQGRRGLLGMALLEARLFYIILVVGAFLSIDLDGSRSRSVLTGWHLVLSWLVLTLPPGQCLFLSFVLSKLEMVVSHRRSLKTRPYKLYHVVGTNHALLVDYLR